MMWRGEMRGTWMGGGEEKEMSEGGGCGDRDGC